MEPKISVILPVYNGEKYLRECLDSIMMQTLAEFEVICVNDGSTDGTLGILTDYQKKDARIRIIDQDNAGYGCAMNRGIEEAAGTYIAVVEADDYIRANMLEALYLAAEQTQAEVVKADYYTFTGNGDERRFTYMQIAPDRRMYGRLLDSTQTTVLFYAVQMTWEGIYRRSFLLKHNIRHNDSPGASFQDNGFWFQVFAQAKRVYFIDTPLYMYRIDNTASSTKQSDLKKIRQMFAEYDFILVFLARNPKLKLRLYPTYLHFRFVNLLSRFFCASDEGKPEIALMIHNELREAAQNAGFSWELFGTALREDLKALLDDPVSFAANPPVSINKLCWEEVSKRPEAERVNADLSIPARLILDYLDGLPDSAPKLEGVRAYGTCR